MINIEKEREAFEDFYKTEILTADHEVEMLDQLTEFHVETGMYEYARMQTAWESWQASTLRAAEKLEGCVVVPKDHVVVPKVPSQEMIQAGLEKVRESWDENPPDGFNSFMWGDMIETWKDMVEAARGGK